MTSKSVVPPLDSKTNEGPSAGGDAVRAARLADLRRRRDEVVDVLVEALLAIGPDGVREPPDPALQHTT